jgi:hypothetical protein
MLDASELRQEIATMSAKLRKIAFWCHSPPFARRDDTVQRRVRPIEGRAGHDPTALARVSAKPENHPFSFGSAQADAF